MGRVFYDLGCERRGATKKAITESKRDSTPVATTFDAPLLENLTLVDPEVPNLITLLDFLPILIPSPCATVFKVSGDDKAKECKETSTYWLSQRDFECSEGLILCKPGLYKLCENIVFSPRSERTSAITIGHSNITLDLGRHILRQGNATPLIYGVGIKRGVRNILITGRDKEAQILNFTLAGIRVLGNTDTITIENLTISQRIPQQLTNDQIPIQCTDIIALRLNYGVCIGEGDTGNIAFAGTVRTNLVSNVIVRNSTIKRSTIGLQMIFTSEITVSDCFIIENTYYGALFGTSWIILDEAKTDTIFPVVWNGKVQRSRFDKNRGLNSNLSNPEELFVFDFVSGLAFYGAQTFDVDSCTTHENFNDGFILAVDHDGSHNMTWSNHSSKRNQSILETCDGWHHSGSVANTLSPCLGMLFPFSQNENLVLRNSVSVENSSPVSCSGFRFAFPYGVSVSNCVSMGNTSGGIGSGFRAQGALPGGEGKQLVWDNCVAQKNNGGEEGDVAGFLINQVMSDVIVRGCIAQGNGALSNAAPTTAGGVVVHATSVAGIDKVTIEGCTLNRNGNASATFSGGIVVVGEVGFPVSRVLIQKNTMAYNIGDGVLLSGEVSGVVIKANEADQNSSIGFDVSGTASTTLVMTNIAYNNTTGNYLGVPPAVIIVTTTATLPNQVGAQNLDIVP